MCLAIPMRITATDGADATIEADGLVQRTSLMLVPDARVGDFVLVHAGFAIAVLDEGEAVERLALFDELAALAGESGGLGGPDEADEVDDGHPEDPSI